MEKLYAHYSFTIILETNQNLFGATEAIIKLRKPDSSNSDLIEISATIIDINAGVLKAKISATKNDKVGKWAAWAYVVFADGDDQPGDTFHFEIYREGY